MGRLKAPPAASKSEPAALEDAVLELKDEVSTLAQQVEVLRVAIDDLREELQFAIRNLPREPWVPVQPLVSMPRDPLADPFSVNRTRREDLPVESTCPSTPSEPPAPAEVAVEAPALRKKKQKAGELF